MAKYYIKYSELRGQGAFFHAAGKAISDCENRLGAVASAIDDRDGSMRLIRTKLVTAINGLPALRRKLSLVENAIHGISASYESAEKRTTQGFDSIKI